MPDYFVGKTKVFIRKQLTKILFDDIRDSSSSNVVVPIQRVIRGFLARQFLQKTLGESKRALQEEKKRESYERSLMALEDQLSLSLELILRNDKDLQRKLHEAKQQRLREEKAKREKRRFEAIVAIQRIVRGFVQRRKSDVFLVERLCELALQSRDELLMERALKKSKELSNQRGGSCPKVISLYRKSIKNVLLEIMNEKYVTGSPSPITFIPPLLSSPTLLFSSLLFSGILLEAVQVRSVPLLQSALQLAQDNNMTYLPEMQTAAFLLHELSNHRVILNLLHDELSKCNSISNFMKKYDIVHYLILQSLHYDLQGEKIVVDASLRIGKIENLYKLRQSLRHALEICSPTKMIKLMQERAKYLKLFSEEFLEEEANAVEKMMAMLKYKQTLLAPFLNNAISPSKGGGGGMGGVGGGGNEDISLIDDEPLTVVSLEQQMKGLKTSGGEEEMKQLNMHEIYHLVIHNPAMEGSNAADNTQEIFQTIQSLSEFSPTKLAKVASQFEDRDFIYLPRFVREPLGKMRAARNDTGELLPSFISPPSSSDLLLLLYRAGGCHRRVRQARS